MADAFGRLTGKPQMCYATFGPGLTNLSTGVCSAIFDRSPMLVVSAQIQRSEICFNQTHQCIDNVEFMRPLTKFSYQLECLNEIPEVLNKSLSIAVSEIPGPVYLSFPIDLMKEEINDIEAQKLLDAMPPIIRQEAKSPDYEKLNVIIEKLIMAKHPIVIVGNQIIREDCEDKLLKLISALNVPVLPTLAAKGVVSDENFLLITPGNKYIDEIYQIKIIDMIFSDCDLIILIGYDFGEDLKPSLWHNKIPSIVINSFYNNMASVYQPDMVCLGDLSKSLDYIYKANIPHKILTPSIKKARDICDRRMINEIENTSDVALIMHSIRQAIGKDGILCSDIGLHKQYAGLLTKTYLSNTFICSNVCGTFGFGLPAGMGAKLAKPEMRVCVICGDGGFHSTSHDLETVVRYNIPIVIIVLNDNAFGLIKYYQLLSREKYFVNSCSFGKVDFVKLANANGMKANYVKDVSKLEGIMDKGFSSKKPLLIEMPINYQYKL